MKAIKMAENIYRVGANIENGDLFEGMWPIPDGVSLNAYVLTGLKTALIDLVRDWDNAPDELTKQIDELGIKKFDYLILNHIEPDHTGWLNGFLRKHPDTKILTTKKGAAMIEGFYHVTENVSVVKSGDTLDLGKGIELVFEEIPNVHWPETMVTYEKSSGILFACDAFGSYGSISEKVFDDQLSEEEHAFYDRESLRYYANIVGSFSVFVQRAVAKLADLEIKMIAPSHGIIWRENPSEIINRYLKFASYMNGPAEPEITIVWGSMYGNTKEVLTSIIEGIRSEGVVVHVHQTPDEDVSWALASAWKSRGLVLGMPTYEYKMFPPMSAVIDMFERKHINNKKVLRFGSYGWSGGAQKEFDKITEGLKWDCMEPVEWQGRAKEEDHKKAYESGKALAKAIKEM
ncbi:MAG: FprA family A-type flavoprotein [Spirochaetales bacterium]|nr:FprA family A-type flavoprotein [Spirochaetales bacterium]